jgi:50S ribosomal protein L16 3-hydroxylase
LRLLGGRPPAAFLRAHWQKEPLLVRGALPGFAGIVGRDALWRLARRDDATSRLVIDHRRGRDRWERHDGPFDDLPALPETHWTLLVHGVERLVPGGWDLLRQFSFVPSARLDDLMVSYAADGGSVGPHDDDYDVFLLQGPGRRRWQIARGGDRATDPRAAIKVLAHFSPEDEWVLEPGDMLYLPPGCAHYGVAEGPCFTYSIGLIAPSTKDLVQSFLGYLGGVLVIDHGLYRDPDLRPPRDPAELPQAMIEHATRALDGIRWDRQLVEDFLGAFLTRPRPRDRFTPQPGTQEALAKRLRGRGRLVLAPASRALWRGDRFYLNGAAQRVPARARALLRTLARERSVPLPLPRPIADDVADALYEAYATGMVATTRGR